MHALLRHTPFLLLASLPAAPAVAADGARIAKPDRGIFGDLDPQLRSHPPAWLLTRACRAADGTAWLQALGHTVAVSPLSAPADAPACPPQPDSDGDGLPDQFDILLGAKKVALDAAPYGSPYRTIPYPNGDVPRTEGVCTDVIIRALRNAGLDLQKLLHDDIARAPSAYPMVHAANANIDHRRVKTLLPYFKRHFAQLGTDPDQLGDWLPGDVVFMDTLPKPGPDHIGIVSDRLGPHGRPLIVNSWTDGYQTSEMDLLGGVPVTHRFRAAEFGDAPVRQALAAVRWQPSAAVKQLVLVRALGPDAPRGVLQRWQRAGDHWQAEGVSTPVDLGRSGLRWGRGLHPESAPAKQEGDGRSPMGAFALGTGFGREPKPRGATWPWRQTNADDRWVDDPASPFYNQWRNLAEIGAASAETLARGDGLYDLALVVAHNMADTKAGAGSAIFLHLTSGGPTAGCTALGRAAMLELLQWLKPAAQPVLVQWAP